MTTIEQQNKIIDNLLSEMHTSVDASRLRDRMRAAGFQIIYTKPAEMTAELAHELTDRAT